MKEDLAISKKENGASLEKDLIEKAIVKKAAEGKETKKTAKKVMKSKSKKMLEFDPGLMPDLDKRFRELLVACNHKKIGAKNFP